MIGRFEEWSIIMRRQTHTHTQNGMDDDLVSDVFSNPKTANFQKSTITKIRFDTTVILFVGHAGR